MTSVLLNGLDDIPWKDLHDAYGPADTAPADIRNLLSSDSETRDKARCRLLSTIYHQDDIFDSTAAAIPFLVRLFVSSDVEDRNELGDLILAIAESATRSDRAIRQRWKRQYELFAHIHTLTEEQKALSEISAVRAVRDALLSQESVLAPMLDVPPESLAEICSQLQSQFEQLKRVASSR